MNALSNSATALTKRTLRRSWEFSSPPSSALLPALVAILCVLPLILLEAGMTFHFPAYNAPYGAEGTPIAEAYDALIGSFTHAALLIGAGTVALCTALLSFAHSVTKRDLLSTVLSIALFWSGFVAITQTIWVEGMLYWTTDLNDFIPFNWAISRFFNVLILVLGGALIYYGQEKTWRAPRPKSLLAFFASAGILALGLLLLTSLTDLPQMIYGEELIKRPWDIPALIMLIGGVTVLFPRIHRLYGNYLSYALWLSTLPFIAAQFYLILGSAQIFDDPFNIAYGLNLMAFSILFGGLLGEYMRTSNEEELLLAERERTQLKMMQLDRLSTVGTLAAGVGHEINNPLAFLIANLDFARSELQDLSEQEENLDHPLALTRLRELNEILASADIGAERIRAIVEDLRLLSSFQDTLSEPVNVTRALRVAIRMSQHQLRHRGHLIEELDEVPTIVGNEARLTQVLINLIVNAIHALPERPVEENEIRLRLYSTQSTLIIEVSDNGQGIKAEHLDHIFEPFFTTKPIGQGSGLGLSLSREIIHTLGGKLAVESAEGEGTTFRVELPR